MSCEKGFSGYLFEMKDNDQSSKDKKNLVLNIVPDFLLLHLSLDCKICLSRFLEHCLVLSTFKVLLVGFKN